MIPVKRIIRGLALFLGLSSVMYSVHAAVLEFNSTYDLVRQVDGLQSPTDIAVTDDGQYVYVIGNLADTLSVFQRSTVTNLLTNSAFYQDDAIDGLLQPHNVVLSPIDNNRYLFVAGRANALHPDTLAVFERNVSNGELRLLEVYQDDAGGSTIGLPSKLVISPTGSHLYVTGVGNDTLAVFAFNANPQIPALRLSWRQTITNTDVANLVSPQSMAISPDGAHLYVAASGADGIIVFSRNATTGELTYQPVLEVTEGMPLSGGGQVAGLVGPVDIQISPDGRHVYVASPGNPGDISSRSALVIFSRDNTSGALDYVTTYSNGGVGENGVQGLQGLTALRMNSDGNYLATVSGFSSLPNVSTDLTLTLFSRNAVNGRLMAELQFTDDASGSFAITNVNNFVFSSDNRALYTASTVAASGRIGIYNNCLGLPPIANAGNDFNVNEGIPAPVQLNGNTSLPNCDVIASYAWRQVSGPNVTLQNANTATASFVVPADVAQDTSLVFELTVANSFGASQTDTVTVTVMDTSCAGIVPVANAGNDSSAVENDAQAVQLDGSGSAVSCGWITSYAWLQFAGPAVTLLNGDTATPSFQPPANVDQDTDLTFQLTVTSNNGSTSTDTVTVTIVNANNPPRLTNDLCIIEPGTSVTIDVLANDIDDDGPQPLEVLSRPATTQGPVDYGSDSISYNAPVLAPNGTGGVIPVIDRFSYGATDSVNESTQDAEVAVLVNELPELQDDIFLFDPERTAPQTLLLLTNDRFVSSDAVIILPENSQTRNGGSLALNPDGSVSYIAPQNNSGASDEFVYTVVSAETKSFADQNGLQLFSNNPACLQGTSTGHVTINFLTDNNNSQTPTQGKGNNRATSGGGGGGSFAFINILILCLVWARRKLIRMR